MSFGGSWNLSQKTPAGFSMRVLLPAGCGLWHLLPLFCARRNRRIIVEHYSHIFWELIRTPFQDVSLIWGIVPLYFGLLLNELTSAKANFRTAIQTGFSFLWAGAQWLYPYVKFHDAIGAQLALKMSRVSLLVTILVIGLGLAALVCGLAKKFPRYGSFLGHTRFANYFMIAIFPIQTPVRAFHLPWTWDRLLAIVLFAVPVWLLLHFGLMPIRNRR